jgi:hypothetical protein
MDHFFVAALSENYAGDRGDEFNLSAVFCTSTAIKNAFIGIKIYKRKNIF